jgi:hypothetical protein
MPILKWLTGFGFEGFWFEFFANKSTKLYQTTSPPKGKQAQVRYFVLEKFSNVVCCKKLIFRGKKAIREKKLLLQKKNL